MALIKHGESCSINIFERLKIYSREAEYLKKLVRYFKEQQNNKLIEKILIGV